MIRMEQTMRWYGPHDTVSLGSIRQAGCTGVVTALHHIPVGEVWTVAEIEARRQEIEAAGMSWTVIESLPVHEAIKTRTGNYQRFIGNYKASLRNIAAYGLKVITYNFMPVLDWVRTDISYRLPDGSEALRFERAAFAAFDLFMLKRPQAELDYTPDEIAAARSRYDGMPAPERRALKKTVLLGLPGSDDAFTPEQLLSLLGSYEGITGDALKTHLFEFIKEVSPVAAELGLKMAIHPDDPPYPVLGLPRVVSTQQDARDLLRAASNPANGLCFCTGSFGARADNDILAMLQEFGDRIHFLHLRNTKRDAAGNFYEADHLSGDTDMAAVVDAIVALMERTGRSIPMRPDHGHRMLDDLQKTSYPGYSAIGRLKGLAELRGLEAGIFHRRQATNQG